MSVCDVAIGVHGARFGFTEARLGLIPATIGPYVLARMGEDRVRRVFMSARLFDAAEAVALNLLASVVDAEDLDVAGAHHGARRVAPERGVQPRERDVDLGDRLDDAEDARRVG